MACHVFSAWATLQVSEALFYILIYLFFVCLVIFVFIYLFSYFCINKKNLYLIFYFFIIIIFKFFFISVKLKDSRKQQCASRKVWVWTRCCGNLMSVSVKWVSSLPFYVFSYFILFQGAKCSSVARAFTHGAMGLRIDPSWWTHCAFIVPASAPQL